MGLSSETPRVAPACGGFTALDWPRGREFAIQLYPGVGGFAIQVIDLIQARGLQGPPEVHKS